MDIATLMAAIGIIKKMPDTAASRAEAAAGRAEDAADLAVEHGYGITFVDGYEIISEEE